MLYSNGLLASWTQIKKLYCFVSYVFSTFSFKCIFPFSCSIAFSKPAYGWNPPDNHFTNHNFLGFKMSIVPRGSLATTRELEYDILETYSKGTCKPLLRFQEIYSTTTPSKTRVYKGYIIFPPQKNRTKKQLSQGFGWIFPRGPQVKPSDTPPPSQAPWDVEAPRSAWRPGAQRFFF